jgi:ribosomal protein S18 acetylase RimI-like enzyme
VSDPESTHRVQALAQQRRVFEQFDWWSLEELGAHVRVDDRGRSGLCIAPVQGDEACAWLRWAAAADGSTPARDWMSLLRRGLDESRANGIADVWCVVAHGAWLTAYLREAGFQKCDEIITLELRAPGGLPVPSADSVTLRDAHAGDAGAISTVDAQAFRAPWRYPGPVITRVLARVSLMRVAEEPPGVVLGYQCATLHDDQAHITRLAVTPPRSRQRIGSRLLRDAIEQLNMRGAGRITLNTPASFDTLGFYRQHGFRPLNEIADVYRLTL